MREPRIEKAVINIGVGEGGDKLLKAERVLQILTGRKPIRTLARVTNKEWGLKPGMPIGCRVTLRGEEAVKFLKSAFWAKDNKLLYSSFNRYGSFSFGIPDYTDFPGIKYDPSIGIFGMDITVRLVRAGARVECRKRKPCKLPLKQKVTLQETIDYLKTKFGVEVLSE
jgi:large subunit ribosomal protein L5